MALTSMLKDSHSSISQWMEAHVSPSGVKAVAKEINATLAMHPPLIVEGTEPPIVGTAFDYGFRWLIGPLDAERLVAMRGANVGRSYEWARLMPSVLTQLVEDGNASPDPQKRAQATIILAWCEHCARQLEYVPPALLIVFPPEEQPGLESTALHGIEKSSIKTAPQAEVKATIEKLYAQIPSQTLQDVVQLLETIPSVWGDDLKQPFILNPTFEGSADVFGADADWIAGNVLYECKCTKRNRPFDRLMLLQLLGYALLDYSDSYSIGGVGWYFARQQVRVIYPLQDFLNRVCGPIDINSLRENLAATLHEQGKSKKSK